MLFCLPVLVTVSVFFMFLRLHISVYTCVYICACVFVCLSESVCV